MIHQLLLHSRVTQLCIYICVGIYMYIFFLIFFSILFYHRILNIVPCGIKQDLVINPSCIYQFAVANPRHPILPFSILPPSWQPQICSLCCESFYLIDRFICVIIQIPCISDIICHLYDIQVFVFLFMTYFIEYDNLQIYPCCCKMQSFLFHCWVIFSLALLSKTLALNIPLMFTAGQDTNFSRVYTQE